MPLDIINRGIEMFQEWGLILALSWAAIFGYSGFSNETKKPDAEIIILIKEDITTKDFGIIN